MIALSAVLANLSGCVAGATESLGPYLKMLGATMVFGVSWLPSQQQQKTSGFIHGFRTFAFPSSLTSRAGSPDFSNNHWRNQLKLASSEALNPESQLVGAAGGDGPSECDSALAEDSRRGQVQGPGTRLHSLPSHACGDRGPWGIPR